MEYALRMRIGRIPDGKRFRYTKCLTVGGGFNRSVGSVPLAFRDGRFGKPGYILCTSEIAPGVSRKWLVLK